MIGFQNFLKIFENFFVFFWRPDQPQKIEVHFSKNKVVRKLFYSCFLLDQELFFSYNKVSKRCDNLGQLNGATFYKIKYQILLLGQLWGNFGATLGQLREGEGNKKGTDFSVPLCIKNPYTVRLYITF
ncbi:MAG: hypothetical protein IJ309_06940 [Clostridia bacterium]|nr:hypothetical protein [Clostridia bacterium]